MAITAGLYEIRSMLLTSMGLDIAGGSKVKGGNVQLYGANDTNAQKFYLVEETVGHWSIQNAQSTLYMDVANGAAANGTNVQQWTDNDTRAQRWKIIDSGNTTTINGETCPIVTLGSYITDDGATYVADVTQAMTTAKTNIQLWHSNNTPAQQFALVPTTLLDTQMPVPSLLGWATGLYLGAQQVQIAQSTLYPVWAYTDAWSGLTDHGFEIQYRTRSMADNSASYGAWGAYTAWASAGVTLSGQAAWLSSGISGALASGNKAKEYDFRVRSTSTVGGRAYHSQPASMTLRAVDLPTLGITGATRVAGTTPAMRLAVTSSYTGGTTMVRITGVRQYASGGVYGSNLLAKPLVAYGKGASFDVDVPLANFKTLPALGALRVDYELGTDQYLAASYVGSKSGITYANAANKTKTVTGSISFVRNAATALLSLSVSPDSSSETLTTKVYLDAGGEVLEVALDLDTYAYQLPYPFDKACTWYAFVSSSNGTWGVASGTIAADNSRKVKPRHAWNWQGANGENGYLDLSYSDSTLRTTRTLKPDYTDYQLSGREWHAAKFGGGVDGEFSAEGVLVDGLTVANKAVLLNLLHAQHVIYRAPSGEVAYVAITEIQYTTDATMTRVTITMMQESL